MDDRLSAGSVIFEKVTDTIPPKDKYYVVAALSEDRALLGTVYINTTINPKIFNTPELVALHVPIYSTDDSFLDHNSYIDCSTLIERPIERVQEIIRNGQGRYGYTASVSGDCFKQVIDTLKSADTITPIAKKKFKLI